MRGRPTGQQGFVRPSPPPHDTFEAMAESKVSRIQVLQTDCGILSAHGEHRNAQALNTGDIIGDSMRITGWPAAGLLWLLALHPAAPAGAAPADLVVTDARIYTVDAKRSVAEALAVSGGRIVFVGSALEARELIGPATQVKSLGGRLVLPGLVDAHVHPLDIADLDVCDLDNKPVSLRALTDFVRACLERYQTPAGELLAVHEWNYSDGNTPDAEAPTLRAALDRASTRVKIQLLGND